MSDVIPMPAASPPPRWAVSVSYGPCEQETGAFDDAAHCHHFAVDELYEIDEKIERGPDFTRIKEVSIRYALRDAEPSDEELIAALRKDSHVFPGTVLSGEWYIQPPANDGVDHMVVEVTPELTDDIRGEVAAGIKAGQSAEEIAERVVNMIRLTSQSRDFNQSYPSSEGDISR